MISLKALLALPTGENAPRKQLATKGESPGWGDTPLFGLYGDVPLDRVWFFGRCPKQGVQFDLPLS